MIKRKAIWALLAAGMTVVSTGVVSAQRVDRETLARMMLRRRRESSRRVAAGTAPKAGHARGRIR